VPLGIVTSTLPLVAPAGTVVVISVAETIVNIVGAPLKVTLVVPARLVPKMSTRCPTLPTMGSVFTKGPASCNPQEDIIDFMPMNIERLKRITVEEGKCGGRPCIRGLRLRVSDVLDLLAAGASYEEILTDYPFLEREDILAAIEYAARQADHIVLATS